MYGEIGIFLIFIMIVGGLIVRNKEYKMWNKGICTKCGNNLESFDTDSQGGTGWICRKCNHSFWTSAWVKTK